MARTSTQTSSIYISNAAVQISGNCFKVWRLRLAACDVMSPPVQDWRAKAGAALMRLKMDAVPELFGRRSSELQRPPALARR